MKLTTTLALIALLLISCSQQIAQPKCPIGHLERRTNGNITFIRDMDADTIHFRFLLPGYGYVPSYWGPETNWDCIGFTYAEGFTLDVWTNDHSCTLTLPNE